MHYTAQRFSHDERRSDQPAGQPADLPVRQVVFEGTHYYIVRDVLAAAGRSTRGATDAVHSLPLADYTRLLEAAVARAGGPALAAAPARTSPRAPLTPEQRAARTAEVRRLAAEGVPNSQIAKRLGLDDRHVWGTVRGRGLRR